MPRRHTRVQRVAAAALLLWLPACSVSVREPTIEPLDTDRRYQAACDPTWESTLGVIEEMPPAVEERERRERAGLITTGFAVLSDTGAEINHLDQVAFSRGGRFIGGRYALTVTVRCLEEQETKVKVVSRIEGYVNQEMGYQVLRSKGLLEEEVFARIGESLGTPPVNASTTPP